MTAEELQDSARLNNTLVERLTHLSHLMLHDMNRVLTSSSVHSEIFPFSI